jgi:hypothetical protein
MQGVGTKDDILHPAAKKQAGDLVGTAEVPLED